MTDASIWYWIATGAGGMAGTLAVWVWNDNKERVRMIEHKLESKADKAIVETHRTYFAKVFEKLDEIKDQMHANHVEALKALSEKADR